MTLRSPSAIKRVLSTYAALGALLGTAAPHAEVPSDAPAAAPAAATIDPEVRGALMDMARFLAGTQRFRVEMVVAYDAVQSSGQSVEFNERRTLVVERPSRLRVEGHGSEGVQQQLVYDGRLLTLSSLPANVYAQSEVAGTIDDAVKQFVEKLGMRLPLAVMLLSNFPAELERRLEAAEFVETTSIFGSPAHHIVGSVGAVDFQVWIADGEKPLPQRIVLTYKEAEGKPQFRAQFSDWDLAPTLDATLFSFAPPAGAHPITFAAELAKIRAIAPPATGESP